jgi:hypothetical protein
MMKLLCGENFLEYAGGGWFQCGRHVNCPKTDKDRNKVLGFDCLIYIDNLPNGCKIDIPEQEPTNDNLIKIDIVPVQDRNENGQVVAHKNRPAIQIIPASEQIVPGVK